MTERQARVGWYLHHQGAGHRTRFESVRRELDADVVVFSTLPPPTVLPDHTQWVILDRDDNRERRASGERLDPSAADPAAGGALHWAPLGHSGHASRLGTIAASLASERYDCFVVDVSVEVTLLARLFGVRVVVMAQPGERDDAPHQLAYSVAERIVAPWPRALYTPRSLRPFDDRVRFVGGISRFDGRPAPAGGASRGLAAEGLAAEGLAAEDAAPAGVGASGVAAAPAGSVLLLVGAGGAAVGAEDVEAAAVATGATAVAAAADVAGGAGAADGVPSSWSALGMPGTEHVSSAGWQSDPFVLLHGAEVVVSFAGQNAVADLAAIGSRAIVIGQPRPFGEQTATADALGAAGLAIVAPSWPEASEWPALLARARALSPDWSAWEVAGAARRAASAIAEVAGAPPARAPESPAPTAPGAGARIAVITLFSEARLGHARNQFALLAATAGRMSATEVVGVWLDETPPPAIDGVTVIHQPPGAAGLRLARGRNAGAAAAIDGGADVLVFLDADCLPGPGMLDTYAEAAAEHPDAMLCGAVTYLPEGFAAATEAELVAATHPHAARPDLPAGETRPANLDEYALFWSLSFACTTRLWQRVGGFDEVYEGYGAEDTDFASTLRASGVELRWVGGAHAYHQYHPTSSPPWQHLDDILRNGALYQQRWGSWPMEGWLAAFAEAGEIELANGVWQRSAVGRSDVARG